MGHPSPCSIWLNVPTHLHSHSSPNPLRKAQGRGPLHTGSQRQHQGCHFIKIHLASSAGRRLTICPGRQPLPSSTPSAGTVVPSQEPSPYSSRASGACPGSWLPGEGGHTLSQAPSIRGPVLDSRAAPKGQAFVPFFPQSLGADLLWCILHLICMWFIKYKHV